MTKEITKITFEDLKDPFAAPFKNDKERIKYMSRLYKNKGVAESFADFYNMDISNAVLKNNDINIVTNIEVGKVYCGEVKEFTKTTLSLSMPGVKEEIVAKDNFATCIDEVNYYLTTHNNKLLFEVREKRDNKYIVSVTQGFYRAWVDKINRTIEEKNAIKVHIDELVRGGYVCHTNIDELKALTGKNYTHLVFVPGSQIVLNIERDFEKWVGEDVLVVPQKFTDYVDFKAGVSGPMQRSLVSSRKLVLQTIGMRNMYDIYTDVMMKQKLASSNATVAITPTVFGGTVTGIINSAKKTGIFVELNDKYITGLMPVDSADIVNYRPGDQIQVTISEFEVQEGKEPFVTNKKGTVIHKCNVRPVFALA